jgi:hypothetical protein
MTIVVGVATPDGIVLAADSRMTLCFDDGNGGVRYRIGSDTGEKVFEVCTRYAVATFGDAMIGTQTIAGVMAEFESQDEAHQSRDVAEFADRLGEYFNQRYTAAREDAGNPVRRGEEGAIGFLVAGYDASGVGHVYDVLVPTGGRAGDGLLTTVGGISPRGQTDVIWRLLRGFDADAAHAIGIRLDARLARQIDGLHYNVLYPFTLQDAIDLGTFLIRTTIDMQRFSDGLYAAPVGVPGCGGPVNMIAVKQNSVEWVSRASLAVGTRGQAEGAL